MRTGCCGALASSSDALERVSMAAMACCSMDWSDPSSSSNVVGDNSWEGVDRSSSDTELDTTAGIEAVVALLLLVVVVLVVGGP